MSKKLFGTDGIRGVAGQPPLDPVTVSAFGMALAADLVKHANNPEVIIGMDTRESGPWIAEHVAGGLAKGGVAARFAGIVTTPGVAYLTRSRGFAAGVMISASHNPYQDNGIKVFAHNGYKLPDEEEALIEDEILRLRDGVHSKPISVDSSLDHYYLDYLLATMRSPLTGMKVVIDCGNGAASALAPDLFRRAGADVVAINDRPDGRNINLNCGALHVAGLRDAVLREHADAGAAFDGDADRAILISASCKIIDGDHMLLIAARALKVDSVVATVMSNLGLERALERDGIRLLRTPVGDKYVLEEMVRTGAAIGGEQSGHVIFREYATTGDGMLTALRIFEIARTAGESLDELTRDLAIYPQKLVNVRFRERRPLRDLPAVVAEIERAEKVLNGNGRVLVRFSGTEPLARVMVEAADPALVESFSESIADAIRSEIG